MGWVMFLFVVALRLFVPLLILRYPLPAILAALVIDAADQTMFQAVDIDLEAFNYQAYDKALDIYYLTIAYLAMYRNWSNQTAVTVGVVLWFYRLFGVTLFELTEWRPLLLIFPNTFEYYFIAIELVRLRWDMGRLSSRTVVAIAAGIWVFIKLPQEWWIHIAKLDVTDFVKEDLLGVDAADSWGTALGNRPLVTVAMIAVVAAIIGTAAYAWRRTPPADHPLTVDADRVPPRRATEQRVLRAWTDGLAEKVILVVLITIIFAQALESEATIPQILFAVIVIVATNAYLSLLLRRRGGDWSTTFRAFGGMLVLNTGIWLALVALMPTDDDRWSDLGGSAFFLLLLTLIVTLFDRYSPVRRPAAPASNDLRRAVA